MYCFLFPDSLASVFRITMAMFGGNGNRKCRRIVMGGGPTDWQGVWDNNVIMGIKDAYKVFYLLDRFMQMHETGKFGICDLVSLLYLPFVMQHVLK